MLNSLASLFWGNTMNSEQGNADSDTKVNSEQGNADSDTKDVNGVHLETQQDDDWVVVNTAGENVLIVQQAEETENRDSNGQPLVHEDGQPREETSVLQPRNNINHAAVHPGLVSAEQLVKSIHLAQRMQLNKAQKHISKSKCERQNKVRECNSHGKGNSRRNKLIHPSGVRSSRFSQRF